MNRDISGFIELTMIFLAFFLGQYLIYRFPHFSMHFTDGISIFGIDDVDFDKVCKKHSKEDIARYKMKQKRILICLGFGEISILVYYVITHIIRT